MKKKSNVIASIGWLIGIFITISSIAQESVDDLSVKLANPLANLMTFPFQNNTTLGSGPNNNQTFNVLNIQPVIPFANGRFITRTIFPIVSIPDYTTGEGYLSSGLSDIIFTAFYSPEPKGVIWGIGPVLSIPSGGSLRGTQKWSVGPSVVTLAQSGTWTYGFVGNILWSFAGDENRNDVNKALLNLFLVYQLGNGWSVNSVPIITVDLKAASGQKWIIPLGGGVSKLLMLGGKLPMMTQLGCYYNVFRPDLTGPVELRAMINFVLPTPGSMKK